MADKRFILVLPLLLAAIVLGPGSLVAADQTPPGLTMEAGAAFDGYFKFGEWLPVWVELENSGPDLDAEVRVRLSGGGGTTVFAAPAPLPTGSHKRIPVYVLANNYSHELDVQLVEGGEVLVSRKVRVNPSTSNTYLIGLAAPERGALSLLEGVEVSDQRRPKEIVAVPLADLPERPEGIYSLDCLILNDVDTSSLSPQQRATLETWVRQGGRLVIGGGAGAARTAAGLPDSLLPLVPGDVVETDSVKGLSALVQFLPVRTAGPFVVATGQLAGGQVLAAQDGLPLVVERAVGSGYADLIALDLAASPFDGWAGTVDFWSSLLSPGATYPTWLPPDASLRQMRTGPMSYALSNLPSLDLPSVQGLAVLLAVYIVLVGPANYFLLRWRKRLHWAWITTPLLTLLFSAGAFGLAYGMHGTDLILNKIAIVELQPDGMADVESYVGLFSPSQQSYEIEVMDGGLLSPVNVDYNPWGGGGLPGAGEMVFVQGEPGRVTGLTVNQWSMQTFAVENIWADFGRVVGDFQVEDEALVGTVRNETGHKLSDVAVILGSSFVKLGALGPGESAPVSLKFLPSNNTVFGPPIAYRLFEEEMSRSGPGGPSREAQLKQSVLESVFQPSGWSLEPSSSRLGIAGGATAQKSFVLVGWMDSAPPALRVNGRAPVERATALVYTPLTYRLPDEGPVSLPPGLVQGTLAEAPAEGGSCGPPGTTAIYIGRGEAVLEFRLPEEMRGIQADELRLVLTTDGGWTSGQDTAVYNWETAAWDEYDGVSVGTNVIPDARPLLSADGLVRVRLSSSSGSRGCQSLELGLTGTR